MHPTISATRSEGASDQPATRLAKFLSQRGWGSRRQLELRIREGRVTVNGAVILDPAYGTHPQDQVTFDGTKVQASSPPARLFAYHKPRGLLTTHHDPQGRPTVFQDLSTKMPEGVQRFISVGRLDMDSEGLLLLTTSGALARTLELPATGLQRTYHVRVYGHVDLDHLSRLAQGITVEGIHYGAIRAQLLRQSGRNSWVEVTLHEGKNREIRRVFAHMNLQVNKLIRLSYGPFFLDTLSSGDLREESKDAITVS